MLASFLSENGITMNGISIQINALAGMHIRAERALQEGEVIAKIPKDVILSIRNTAIADVLQQFEVGGLLGLALALMFENAQGTASPWYEYLISLPEKVDIPLLWRQVDGLDGTELGEAVIQDKIALKDDYDSIILPILQEPLFSPLGEYSFEKFQYASSVVSSRAFYVDEYHQQALVPLADIENVHLQYNSNVCEFCGESGICDCAILDHVNEMGNLKDIENDCASMLEKQVSDNDIEEADDGIMEMVVVNSCDSKNEVFNTYGQHSNSYLLNRYGFCEEKNPSDVINFDMEDVLYLLKQLSIKFMSKRIEFWEKLGRKVCYKLENMIQIQRELDLSKEEMQNYDEEENDEPLDDGFYLDYYHQPSFHLYCFLQLMLMKITTLNMITTDITKYQTLIEKLACKKWSSNAKLGDVLPISTSMGQIIYILCKDRLAKYPTTLIEDMELYDSIRETDQQKLKSLLILRISDKRILKGFIDNINSTQTFTKYSI